MPPPNMMFNSRDPENRSLLARMTGTGAFRPQYKGVAPAPGSGLPFSQQVAGIMTSPAE